MIFCIFTYIPFGVNRSYFHFKGRSSVSIIQFNNVILQIKQIAIFRNFRGIQFSQSGV